MLQAVEEVVRAVELGSLKGTAAVLACRTA
jgi:hypothetical protein